MSLCPHGIRIEHRNCDRCEEIAAAENRASMGNRVSMRKNLRVDAEGRSALLRAIWEEGIRIARSYGDNIIHLEGEEKERQWERAKKRILTENEAAEWTPVSLARHFHETYEQLAPDFGYKTREASAKPWAEVPEQNKQLMIAVCTVILKDLHG